MCTIRLRRLQPCGLGLPFYPPEVNLARVTVEDCLDNCENRFALSSSPRRARAIMEGDASLVDTKNKSVVTALREIAAGHVEFDRPINDLLQDGIR